MKRLGSRLLLAAALMVSTFHGDLKAENSGPSEYLVKAGYLYNFALLVEWPTAASPEPGQPMVIGVLGNNEFADILETVVSGKRIDGHAFVVRRLKKKEFLECRCHILFIAAQERTRIGEIVGALGSASVLTVSETPGFTSRGGMINFILEDSRVRFEANADAARHAGLNISSRLLNLARGAHAVAAARPPE
jgi:hypothetical protein